MIPFNDLGRRARRHEAALGRRFRGVLRSGRFILGPRVAQFEGAFAGFCGARHGVGVASGTEALWLALEGLGVGEGDEVVTAANTCAPTVAAILQAGATPVLADVRPDTLTIDPASVEAAVTRRTRCILPVHLYGQCADLEPLLALARRKGLFVLEDCAQAHGASYRGRRAGAWGDAAAFSFYPTKNLGGLGDGGMVVTSDAALARRVRLLRQYGYASPGVSILKGYNSRLDELQAALLLEGLRGLEQDNSRRRAIARAYAEALRKTGLAPPVETQRHGHVYHLFVVRSRSREAFRRALLRRGVETAVHYPLPLHRQKGFSRHCRVGPGGLREAEEACAQVVSLPMFPELSDREVRQVAAALESVGHPTS